MKGEFDRFDLLIQRPVVVFFVLAVGILIGVVILGHKLTINFEAVRKNQDKTKRLTY